MIKILEHSKNAFQFKVQTQSGDTLLTSITFPDKNKMNEIIRNLKSGHLTQNHFERQTNTEGKFLFCLKDDNGDKTGYSEAYDSEAGMENGIENLSAIITSLP